MARPPIRVLIIDDDDEVRLVFQYAGEAFGLVVTQAAAVDEALQQLAGGLIVDVVMCDISMPDGGADTWLRAAADAYPELVERTLVITGWVPADSDMTLSQVKPENRLFKPFAMSDVRRAAARVAGVSAD